MPISGETARLSCVNVLLGFYINNESELKTPNVQYTDRYAAERIPRADGEQALDHGRGRSVLEVCHDQPVQTSADGVHHPSMSS